MNEDRVEYVFDQHSSQPPQVISMTQERYDKAIAEARIKTLEEVCEVLCIHCENRDSTITKDERGEYVHFWFGKEYVLECKAGMIRRLMAR